MSPLERIILWLVMVAYVLGELALELITALGEAFDLIEDDGNNPSGGSY